MRRFASAEWRERIAAGFQDFIKFEFLARETVGLGHLPGIGSDEAVLGAGADGARCSLCASMRSRRCREAKMGMRD